MRLFRNCSSDFKKNLPSYVLLLPAFLYTVIFGYLTYPYMAIAFENYDYEKGIFSDFVGLRNFEAFFKSTQAWQVTRNTLLLNFLFIFIGTLAAVLLAILLNEIRCRIFLKFSQSVILFPYFISWVIVSFILYALLSTDTGMINNMLAALGLPRVNFYSSPGMWPGILTVLKIWKEIGYKAIIFLAAITGIDEGLFEAASIDGAGRWKQIKKILIPLLLPTVSILILFDIGRIFFGDFTMMYSLVGDNGMLLPTTDIIDTFVFRALRLSGNASIAMAVGFYQSVVGSLIVYTVNKLTKKFYPEGALF